MVAIKKVGLIVIYAFFRILPRFLVVFIYDFIKPYSQAVFTGIRYCICKRLCKSVGSKVIIGSNVTFKHWSEISIGNGVSIHDFSYVDGYGGILIGDDVSVAHNCTLISSHHTWQSREMPIRLNPVEKRSIKLGNNIWIGCDVRILGGTEIGNDVIIGAGTVVTKSVPDNGIYFGSPMRFYKKLFQ